MKKLWVLALTILLVAIIGSAHLTHAEEATAAADHAVMHGAEHRNEGFATDTRPHQHRVSRNCQILCAAMAEPDVVRPVLRRSLWHVDILVLGLGVLPSGAAPEVAERPPKQVFV